MEIPHALVKDLRSTGYFFHELKNFSQSPEIDVKTYCIDLTVPFLTNISESYDKAGQPSRSGILRLAIKYLSNPSDDEIVDCIFGLKKVAESEIGKANKASVQEQLDKSRSLANRRRLESVEFVLKLLVNIIKMFRLTNPNANKRKTDMVEDPVFEAILQSWEVLENKGA